MPRPKGTPKTGGRDFKPGVSGNPGGRPKQKRDRIGQETFRRELRENKFDRAELKLKIFKFLKNTQSENAAIHNRKETSSLDTWLIKIIRDGSEKGDEKRLLFLLDQALGKLPTTVGIDKDSAESWAGLVMGLKAAAIEDKP